MMYRKAPILLLLLLSFFAKSQGQLTQIFDQKSYRHASVGLYVLDLNSSKMQVGLNAERCIQPASVAKLVTTAAALELLGPDRRFETQITYTGQIVNGVLEGDLWIRGGGDPSLGSRQTGSNPEAFMTEWVQSVKKAGIQSVNGNILADVGLFDDEPVSPYWLWEDLGNYYAPGIYALAVFDNSYQLELKSETPGSRPEIVSIKPDQPGLSIENQLVAVDNSLDSAYLYGAPYQYERRLFGSMPANRSSFVIRGDMPDPPAFLATYFRQALEKAGISVQGKSLSNRLSKQSPRSSETVLCSTQSIPLSEMIRIIHVKSDNLYTEYLLRQLALTASDKPASAQTGLQVVRNFWKHKGLDVSALFLSDACGLSPNDRISPAFLAGVLRYMAQKSRYSTVFKASFPLAGKDGSVAGFLRNTRLEGKLRLKSGSVQSVNCYAGYYDREGQSYVIVMMVNHADLSRFQIRKDMENFLLSL